MAVGTEVRDLSLKDPWMKTLGTIHGGLELMKAGECDPDESHGHVLTDASGSLAVKMWVLGDNFLIHGDICEKTTQALKLFLDTAMDVGVLCHPSKKLVPPTQVVKCCGFLMDSWGIPCLCVPVGKQERALAVVEHLITAQWIGFS
jgi:hypothetical protein